MRADADSAECWDWRERERGFDECEGVVEVFGVVRWVVLDDDDDEDSVVVNTVGGEGEALGSEASASASASD